MNITNLVIYTIMDTVVYTSTDATTPEIPESNFIGLTPKQEKFVEAYIRLNDATKACIVAGYSPKSANVEANRMLKRANVVNALKDWRKLKREQITKDDFVDLAITDYKTLEVTEPNKPRFLDIAGKALGYIGNESKNQSITNNTQININIDAKQSDLWETARKLLGQ